VADRVLDEGVAEPADELVQEADPGPLTERILARLPGDRSGWIILWGLSALAIPTVARFVLTLNGEPDPGWGFVVERAGPFGATGLAIVISILGSRRIWRAVERASPTIATLSDITVEPALAPLRSTIGPVVLSVLLALATTVDDVPRYGLLVLPIIAPVATIAFLPLMTVLWCYIVVLRALDRVGQRPLRLEGFPADPSLGLAPLGALAFTAFAAVTATTLPILLFATRGLGDLLISLGVLAFSIGFLLLAMLRLHGQLMIAKGRHVAEARALFLAAYEPVRDEATVARVEERYPYLRAAELVLGRAESILEWPIDQALIGRIVAIATGVVTALFSTLLLRQLAL
jgi:hypothetical protein